MSERWNRGFCRPVETPTFSGVHKRLSRERGRASERSCVDCGGPAAEWSYDGKDPNELTEIRRGKPAAYSVDQDRYQPRCRPCHRRFDEVGVGGRDEHGHFTKEIAA